MAKRLINTLVKLGRGTLLPESIEEFKIAFHAGVSSTGGGMFTVTLPRTIDPNKFKSVQITSATTGSSVVTYGYASHNANSLTFRGYNAETRANAGTVTVFIEITLSN